MYARTGVAAPNFHTWREVQKHHTRSDAGVREKTCRAKAPTAAVLRGAVAKKGDMGHDGADTPACRPGTEEGEARHATIVLVEVQE